VANGAGEDVRVVTGAALRVDKPSDVDLCAAALIEGDVVDVQDPIRPVQAAP